MQLPPHLGDIQDLVRREQKAFDHQAMWHEQLTDVYEYFLPQRNLFEVEDKEENLNKAFEAFAEALKIYTREKYPVGYAATQNNL